MTEIKIGDLIKITCPPEVILEITKSPSDGFFIKTIWGGIDKKYDFLIDKDVKVFVQKGNTGK